MHLNHTTSPGIILTDASTAQENSLSTAGAGFLIASSGHATGASNIITFRTEDSNSAFTPSERMRIDSTGNVGIGTTDPDQKLEVGGDSVNIYLRIDADVSKQAALEFTKDDSQEWIIYQPGSSEDLVVFDVDGLNDAVMTFQTGGNVGIGTTNPETLLQIGNGQAQQNITMTSPDGTNYSCGVANGGTFSCS